MVAALAAAGLLSWGAVPASAADEVTRVCRFFDDRFTEISGMTYSLRHADVIWLHNDSGGGPYIYAVDSTSCRTLARLTLDGVEARDIEAIAAGRDGKGRPVIWVADFGDNLDSWPEVHLYRIREPKVLVDQTVTPRRYRVTYRDRPHNAETLLADPTSTRLWIVTKQLAHGRLYELPAHLSRTDLNVARPIEREGGLVTDGAVSPDGRRYVLRDYVNASVFDGTPPGVLTEMISLPVQPQGEAVTWAPDGTALLVASERDNRLFRIEVSASDTNPTVADSQPPPGSASPSSSADESAPTSQPTGGRSEMTVAVVTVAGVLLAGLVVAALLIAGARRRR